MTQTAAEPDGGTTVPKPLVFATYLEAHREAARRRAEEAAKGFIVKVVKSPYGGYTIRSWPEDLLVDPDLRAAVDRGTPEYQNL